jgi:hypothetical protein
MNLLLDNVTFYILLERSLCFTLFKANLEGDCGLI